MPVTPAQETNDNDPPSDENANQGGPKNRLSATLALGRRKKKKGDALDPYRKFVAFYTRSQNPFVNYYAVLDAGMAWETSQFGDLSRDEFLTENAKSLHVYRRLRSGVPQFTQDFYELQQASEELEALQKQLNDVVTSARGADIHSLREKGVSYVELEQPEKQLTPRVDAAAPKSSFRGHNHPVFSRLLCPVKYLADFDTDPAVFQTNLLNSKVRVVAGDFPALLYPYDGFDPDDLESGLFRNPILLRFYKHIFTAPSSARQELTVTSSRPKIKRPQAMLNNMKAVTPGSIGYAALMLRHCISSLEDWRTEDDLFNREEFFDSITSFLDDSDDEWVKDTLNWWNSHVFGTRYSASDDEQDREPSTADLLRQKRATRKEKQREAQRPQGRVESLGFSSHSSSIPVSTQVPPLFRVPQECAPSNRHSATGSLQRSETHSLNSDFYRPDATELTSQHSKPSYARHYRQSSIPLQTHDSNISQDPHGSNQHHCSRYSPPAQDRLRSQSPPGLSRQNHPRYHQAPSSPLQAHRHDSNIPHSSNQRYRNRYTPPAQNRLRSRSPPGLSREMELLP